MCRTIYFADKILLFSSRPVGEPYHEIPLEAGTTLPQAKILNFLETFNFVAVVTPDPDRCFAAFAAAFRLVEAAGGLPDGELKAINGGPMMGRAMVNLGSPVTKGCSGITILSGRDAVRRAPSQCIKCAKCVEACPMGLEPYFLSKMTQKKGWDELEARMITSCIECGSCQATCPAYLPLLDWVRLGKQTVMGLIRERAAAAKK